MRRREFIAGLGSAAAWPLAAGAQQPPAPVIGWLSPQSADDDYKNVISFLQGLRETGYVEGQNVAVEYRYAENQYDRLPALAAVTPPRSGNRIQRHPRNAGGEGSDHDHTDPLCRRR
jgi:putative ABC transport system substrate-binding protein